MKELKRLVEKFSSQSHQNQVWGDTFKRLRQNDVYFTPDLVCHLRRQHIWKKVHNIMQAAGIDYAQHPNEVYDFVCERLAPEASKLR